MPTITINNVDIYFEQHGHGEPLLLITGYSGDHLMWANVLGPLATRYQVTLIDNRDSGLSQRLKHDYSMMDMADDTAALLEHLNIPQAYIVGHSMGGAIAQELALQYPEKIKKLMLYATSAKFDPRCCYIIKQRFYIMQSGLPAEANSRLIGFPWCFSKQFFANPTNIDNALKMVQTAPYSMDIEALGRQFVPLEKHDTRERLSQISAPTLVLAPNEDILTPFSDSELLAAKIPNARLVEIKDQAHCFHLEKPSEFCDLLCEFFT